MEKKPLVSVLMATYNTPDDWLCASIESILHQSYQEFEFLIVDDCSTIGIDHLQKKYNDNRIIWIKNAANLGLTKSLNIALQKAKGQYIARMDADDISLPMRFETQINWMESHPDVIVCGAYRRAFGNEEKDEIWNIPATREEQQIQLFFSNIGLTHPTAMFRKSMLDQYGITYNERYRKAQDYGIWVQCTRFAPMAMIPKVLLHYRKSDIQVTNNKNGVNIYDSMVKTDQLAALGIEATEEEKKMHTLFCRNQYYEDVLTIRAWVDKLRAANQKTHYFDCLLFEKIIKQKWYGYCKTQYVCNNKHEYKQAYLECRGIKELVGDGMLKMKQVIAGVIRRPK